MSGSGTVHLDDDGMHEYDRSLRYANGTVMLIDIIRPLQIAASAGRLMGGYRGIFTDHRQNKGGKRGKDMKMGNER